MPEIERLTQDEQFFEAHRLLQDVIGVLADDPEVERLVDLASLPGTVTSSPPGAAVFIKGYRVDYLETREDIDLDKLAYYGLSRGASVGPTMVASSPDSRGGFRCGWAGLSALPPGSKPRPLLSSGDGSRSHERQVFSTNLSHIRWAF
ncbi:MAG: hypothetical protein E2P02_21725 [Acidobacteria bacterium]|nr:MAG: hypothetical protein E2P02_21725 [Acidobacteriota bacterium]